MGQHSTQRRGRDGVVLHSEHLVQLGIEDCHVRETGFRLEGEALMNHLAQRQRHIGIVQVNGLQMKLTV